MAAVGLRCSLGSEQSKCSSTGEPVKLIPLKACTKHMGSHYKSLSLSNETAEEWRLILNRAGLSENEETEFITICPRHRSTLGVRFQPNRRCAFPGHSDKRGRGHKPSMKVMKGSRPVGLKMSESIKAMSGQSVPIGSVICDSCRKKVYSFRQQPTDPGEESAHASIVLDPGEGTSSQPEQQDYQPRHVQFVDSDVDVSLADLPGVSTSTPWGEHVLPHSFSREYVFDDDDQSVPVKRTKLVMSSGRSQSPSSSDDANVSMWQDQSALQRERRGLLNSLLEAHHYQPLRSTLNTEWEDISTSQKSYYVRKLSECIKAVMSEVVPGEEAKLWDVMKSKNLYTTSASNKEKIKISDTHVQDLIKSYSEASKTAQLQILSLFANDFTKDTLMEAIPGLTRYHVDKARHHALTVGSGEVPPTKVITRTKLDTAKTDHFLDFISQPQYLQDVAFGTKTLKMDNGEKMIIPAVIRTTIPARIIKQYKSYCKDVPITPLSDSTLTRILDVCAASQQKSMAGLDYLTSEGASAFETMAKIVQEVGNSSLSVNMREFEEQLKQCKRYLKTEYVGHLSIDNRCADHCVRYALSDQDTSNYLAKCNHEHDMQCMSCQDLEACLSNIKKVIEEFSETKEVHLHDFNLASSAISDWKSHILRGVNQDLAKVDCLDNLNETSCLLVMDWAMKFLPMYYREDQTRWFGKRGKSWHVSCVVLRQEGELSVECYVHVFEDVTQNWQAVAGIIEDTLKTVAEKHKDVKSCFIRSDNAGCYHNASLLGYLPGIGKRSGISVKRYDFSETQHGKDVCDRKIAPLKRHMRLHVAEGKGNDIVLAKDMKAAMESHGGINGCEVSIGAIDDQGSKQFSIPGISLLNNFAYEDDGKLRVWKYFNIGEGKVVDLPNASLAADIKLVVLEAPKSVAYSRPLHLTQSKKDMFLKVCSECDKTCHTKCEYDEHMEMGWHEKRETSGQTVYDSIRKKWCDLVTGISASVESYKKGEEVSGVSSKCLGWAQKSIKRSEKIPIDVKDYLVNIFEEGLANKQKIDPVRVSRMMRSATNLDGMKRFTSDDWRTPKQIGNFFSRMASCNKRKVAPEENDEADSSEQTTNLYLEEMRNNVYSEINISHPIIWEERDLCHLFQSNTLSQLSMKDLRSICGHFDVHIDQKLSKKKKTTFVESLSILLKACSCQLSETDVE